ncbi:class I adenylate-forming enzyme family protein [Pseudonocardia sp. HH130630-07]|uniref:class I adenylate-forming enzyme family protein n=1 Tax=Pseudonocardia sp. HH130630-07 TaxID=1690815 RepID=UPI000814EB1D|nr:class I adenylate-forming enzyme family protein [Pseudonocardia sp. HH130630-07]ANY07823.1 hypothetical protein AFB00_17680 [Pseudonocardia sp. HH130630-07]
MSTTAAVPAPCTFDAVDRLLADAVDLAPSAEEFPGLAAVVADLAGVGLRPGTPVAIALSNGRPLLAHWFAAVLLGLVPVAVPPSTPSARIRDLAVELGVEALVAARPDPARFGARRHTAVGTERLVRLDGPERPVPACEPGEVLLLTSGTSGRSTACVHRYESLARNAAWHCDSVGLDRTDTVLVSLPLYYSYAIVAQALAALHTGARLVLDGPPFAPAPYRTVLQKHDVTQSSVTPTIVRRLLDDGEPLPAGLRSVTVGGDQLAAVHVAGLVRMDPGRRVYATYGLTEAGPRVTTLAAHAEPAARWGSVGVPVGDVRTELRAAAGPGGPQRCTGTGELVVHTDTALLRTAGPVGRDPLAAPGVVATGDLFHRDDAGYLYFDGRRSEFVVVGGEKVSLRTLRHAAQSLPGVVRAEAVPAEEGGDVVVDLVVDVAGPDAPGPAQVTTGLAPLLTRVERPRRVSVRRADTEGFRK